MKSWNESVRYFTHTVDRLGKKIDEGILEAVVALNMLGIETRASCEGHLDWGLPHPWIDLQPDENGRFLLYTYLVQFYVQRSADFECMLVFHGYRLRSQGAAFSTFMPEADRQHYLQAYQAEMHAFAGFLKTVCKMVEDGVVAVG